MNQSIERQKGTLKDLCRTLDTTNHNGVVEALALDEQNGYIRQDGLCGTITTDGSTPKHNNRVVERYGRQYKIRRLTEKECFRLQGVGDKDFAKIRGNQSKSKLYHLAGDSICVPCIVAIFGQMIDGFDFNEYIQKWYKDYKGE